MNLASLLRRGAVVLFLLLLVMFFSLNSDRFFQERNLINIAAQNAHVVVIVVGMTIVILSGGIDLSVGSVAALVGAISAGLIAQQGMPTAAAVLIGLALGFCLGLINGVLIVFGRLPPFAATLAMLGVARGLTLVYTSGRPISGLGEDFTFWGRGMLGAVPVPIVVWIVVVLVAVLIMTRTRYGLHVYAVGGSEETARLAGVPVRRIRLLTYGFSGLLAGLGGLLLTARIFSAQPQAGVGLELDAITAVVLGGVSLFGGVGNVPGAVTGALLVGILGNGMNLLRVPSYSQQVIQGAVLVLAVAIDFYGKRLETAFGSARSRLPSLRASR